MDSARAKRMTKELLSTSIGGWKLLELSGAGKSAIIFRASKGGAIGAIKVFDPELVERFGEAVQKERVRRELAIKGKKHPNIIEILDGGFDEEKNFYFIVMEFLSFPILSSVLDQVPRQNIWILISQLASASKFLEEIGNAHRDIKPDNIFVTTDFTRIVLGDLGVMQPIGLGRITDAEDQKRFVGTLQYSSPEFLLRNEKDSEDGWRALTFYQIGAVLHDLLMKKCLFHEFSEPFARLVEAVRSEDPKIDAPDVSPDLVLLAKNCLVKDPETRLKFVAWDDFSPRPFKVSSVAEAKQRIMKRKGVLEATGEFSDDTGAERKEMAIRRAQENIESRLQAMLRNECIGSEYFPPLELHVSQDAAQNTRLLVCFSQSQKAGLSAHLCVHFWVELLEVTSTAVSIKLATALSRAPMTFDDFPPGKKSTFFAGVFDENAIRLKLQELLFALLDKSQELCANGAAKKEKPIWFEKDKGEAGQL